jgi:hypothetical protein
LRKKTTAMAITTPTPTTKPSLASLGMFRDSQARNARLTGAVPGAAIYPLKYCRAASARPIAGQGGVHVCRRGPDKGRTSRTPPLSSHLAVSSKAGLFHFFGLESVASGRVIA